MYTSVFKSESAIGAAVCGDLLIKSKTINRSQPAQI